MDQNRFTTVSRQGFGSRIVGAIIGVPVGIILIIGACFLLYWNEGRVDYSKVASQSVVVNPQNVDQSKNNQFVSVTGPISTGAQIGDNAYLLPGSYLALYREVDEYAWVQQVQNSSHNNTGGSSNNSTTYTYTKQWVDMPQDSSTFQYPTGHLNPPKLFQDSNTFAEIGQIGSYQFNPQSISLPAPSLVSLTAANTSLTNSSAAGLPIAKLASSQYLYSGTGSLSAPQIGDIRISYKAIADGITATVFGKTNDGTLSSYTNTKNQSIFDLLYGSRQTAIATLHTRYEDSTWIIRAVGVGIIWIGLILILSPLDTILSFLPIAGRIGGALTIFITLPIALVLGGSVILISYSLHHVIDLVIGVPVTLALILLILKLIKHGRGLSGQPAPGK